MIDMIIGMAIGAGLVLVAIRWGWFTWEYDPRPSIKHARKEHAETEKALEFQQCGGFYDHIGELIRDQIDRRSLDHAKFCTNHDINADSLEELIAGKLDPNEDFLGRIERALGIEKNFLMHWHTVYQRRKGIEL